MIWHADYTPKRQVNCGKLLVKGILFVGFTYSKFFDQNPIIFQKKKELELMVKVSALNKYTSVVFQIIVSLIK